MCNGDLGMYRVMPWAYPTIPGQSSGGTTVDPTPEPTPVPTGPYDLSDYYIRFYSQSTPAELTEDVAVTFFFGISRGGAVEIDTSNVSSIKVTFGSGNMIMSGGGTIPLNSLSVNWSYIGTPFYFDNLNMSYSCIPALDKSAGQQYVGQTVTGFSEGSTMIVNIYDSAGNVLQTKEVVIT